MRLPIRNDSFELDRLVQRQMLLLLSREIKRIGGESGIIPFEKLKKKLEKILSKVRVFVISSGIGEPLLHPELYEILQWLCRINPSLLQRIVTTLTAAKASWFVGRLDYGKK